MNNKIRDALTATVDDNIYQTNYIDMTIEEIEEALLSRGFGLAESKVLSASIKYMIGLKNYEKPTLTKEQKTRVCEYWSHVRSLDTLVGAWGDLSICQLTRKLDKIKIYDHSYIDYILHSHPEIIYIREKDVSKYGNSNKMVKTAKLIDILYNDYLEIKDELLEGNRNL